MVRDPVCGMEIDCDIAEFKTEYDGQTYYFCSAECRQEFEENPERYSHVSSVRPGSSSDRY